MVKQLREHISTVRSVFAIVLLISCYQTVASFEEKLAEAALERTKHSVRYDGSYRAIAYPGGDVPEDIGVCTDVVVRAYRAMGVDLQKRVHEDIKQHFEAYPSKKIWGMSKPDSNIDHRRVPNLQTFFERHGQFLGSNGDPVDFRAGDLVTWMLPGNLPHIAIVSSKIDKVSGEPLIVHNIGRGPKLEKMLFMYQITGHYRYIP